MKSLKPNIRQHRAKTICWILHASCLHIFRHIAQKLLDGRQPACIVFVQSYEKSDGAICAQSLCGIAIICNCIAMACRGALVNAGIYDGKILSTVLYGICFVCSTISLIMTIIKLKKEENHNAAEN